MQSSTASLPLSSLRSSSAEHSTNPLAEYLPGPWTVEPSLSDPANPRRRFNAPRRVGPADNLRPEHWLTPIDPLRARAHRRQRRTTGAVRSASYYAPTNGAVRVLRDDWEKLVGERASSVWYAIEGLRDEHQRVWVSSAAIAKRVGRTQRAVHRALDILRGHGLLTDVGLMRSIDDPDLRLYVRVVVGRLQSDHIWVPYGVKHAIERRHKARRARVAARKDRRPQTPDELALARVRGRLRSALRRWEAGGAYPPPTVPGVSWAALFSALGPRPPGGHLVPARPWSSWRWTRPEDVAAALAPGQLRWGTLAEARAAGAGDASESGQATRQKSCAQKAITTRTKENDPNGCAGRAGPRPVPPGVGRVDGFGGKQAVTMPTATGEADDASVGVRVGVPESAKPPRVASVESEVVPRFATVPEVKSPPMPQIDLDAPEEENAKLLASAYRCAVGHAYGRKSHVLRRGAIERSKLYQKLLEAVSLMLEHRITPHAWVMFSISQWKHANGGAKMPPIGWVYSATRLHKWRGWYRKVANGMAVGGGNVARNGVAIAAEVLRGRIARAVTSARPQTVEQARAVVADALGAESFTREHWTEIERMANVEAERLQDEMDEAVRSERWVWG
jgi:hypothetical protein